MNEEHDDILQRLTRIETKLDNGVTQAIGRIDKWVSKWTEVHPMKCPLVERRLNIVNPILTGVVVGVAVLLVDVVMKVVMR